MENNKHILRGPKPYIELPNESVGQQLHQRLIQHQNLPVAWTDAVSGRNVSFKTILETTCRLAESLNNYGIRENDVVAIFSENNIQYFYSVVAAAYMGIILTTFSYHYGEQEILHTANISKPKVIFCSKTTLKILLQVKDQLKFVQKIVIIDSVEKHNDCENLQDFINNNCKNCDVANFKPKAVDTVNQPAFIFYSSGTTGLPKGVLLTNKNMNTILTLARDPRYNIQVKPGTQAAIGLLPFFHALGFHIVLGSLLLGRRVLMMKSFDPVLFLKTIQNYKISILTLVPPLANFLAKSPLVEKYDLSSVEWIKCGAAPLSVKTHETLMQRIKAKSFHEAYGMTETTLGVLNFQIGENKLGSCGKVVPHVMGKIVDPDTGKTLGPKQNGELCFKGPMVMKGYAGNEQATKEAIDADGWLHTGDVGYYDEEGFFFIVDRIKELIKYKGYQVAPAELEAILMAHPKIVDVGVVGLPNERAGELPVAFVVKAPNQTLTEKDVKTFVARRVSPQKRLYGGVRFVSEIPKNPSGKILRRVLRQQVLKQTSKL